MINLSEEEKIIWKANYKYIFPTERMKYHLIRSCMKTIKFIGREFLYCIHHNYHAFQMTHCLGLQKVFKNFDAFPKCNQKKVDIEENREFLETVLSKQHKHLFKIRKFIIQNLLKEREECYKITEQPQKQQCLLKVNANSLFNYCHRHLFEDLSTSCRQKNSEQLLTDTLFNQKILKKTRDEMLDQYYGID